MIQGNIQTNTNANTNANTSMIQGATVGTSTAFRFRICSYNILGIVIIIIMIIINTIIY